MIDSWENSYFILAGNICEYSQIFGLERMYMNISLVYRCKHTRINDRRANLIMMETQYVLPKVNTIVNYRRHTCY